MTIDLGGATTTRGETTLGLEHAIVAELVAPRSTAHRSPVIPGPSTWSLLDPLNKIS